MKFNFKIIALLLLSLSFLINSCIIVKHESEKKNDVAAEVKLSPKPKLPMGDLLVRSPKGDMISLLPEGWFFVDVEDRVSNDIIAVAVSNDYSVGAVFSFIRNSEPIKKIVEKEGLLGLARISYNKRERKSGGALKQFGKYQEINLGTQNFAVYEFSSTGGAIRAKSAVFISGLDRYYEFSILPMEVNGNPIPPHNEVEEIFSSILATIKY